MNRKIKQIEDKLKNNEIDDNYLDEIFHCFGRYGAYRYEHANYIFLNPLLENGYNFSQLHYQKLFSGANPLVLSMAEHANLNLNIESIAACLVASTSDNILTKLKNVIASNNIILTKKNIGICVWEIYFENEKSEVLSITKFYQLVHKLLNLCVSCGFIFDKLNTIELLETIMNCIRVGLYSPNAFYAHHAVAMKQIIQFFRDQHVQITVDMFIKMMYSERNMMHIMQYASPMYEIIIQNKMLDFEITNENMIQMLRYINKKRLSESDKFMSCLITTYNFHCTQQLFETACQYNNYTLYQYVKSKIEPDYNTQCLKYVCYNANDTMILDFLEQKIFPTTEDILNICVSDSKGKDAIINKIIGYGLSVTDEIYEILRFAGINPTVNHIDEVIINRMNNYCQTTLTSALRKKYDDLQTNVLVGNAQDHLRNLYLMSNLDNINYFEGKHNLVPDVLCFENALLNKELTVMSHVFENYNYVPNVLAITRIKEEEKRFTLLRKFYPELCKIDYKTNVCNDFKLLQQDDNPSNADKSTEGAKETKTKKTNSKAKVVINAKMH